jgi:hypothetical protein
MVCGIRTGRLLLPLVEQGDQWRVETRLEILDVCALWVEICSNYRWSQRKSNEIG